MVSAMSSAGGEREGNVVMATTRPMSLFGR